MINRFFDWMVWVATCEPLRLQGAIQSTLAIFVIMNWLPEQLVGALMVAVAAWLGLGIRNRVTPTNGTGTSDSSSGRAKALSLAFATLVLASGCATKVVPPTPKAQAAFNATQVSIRVNELADVIMEAHKQKQIATAPARTIVQFCIDANFVLAETPNGWQAQVVAAWDQAKKRLPPDFPATADTKVRLLWIGVSSMIEAFRQPPGGVELPDVEACLAY